MEITALARAKINLAIDVLCRQADGYHQVALVLQSIELADRLIFRLRPEGIKITCTEPALSCGKENLVYQAAVILQGKIPMGRITRKIRGIEIHIEKNIPMEAGLAGGSSDAAAALLVLNEMWDLRLSGSTLAAIALSLGADVPFCLIGGTVLAQGIGEKITPLPALPRLPLVLVKPSFGLSASAVYSSLDLHKIQKRPNITEIKKSLAENNLAGIYRNLVNVLEEGLGDRYEEINQLKETMLSLGSMGALMSGSGSVVFGFFDDSRQAQEAASSFREMGYWSCATVTSSQGIRVQGT